MVDEADKTNKPHPDQKPATAFPPLTKGGSPQGATSTPQNNPGPGPGVTPAVPEGGSTGTVQQAAEKGELAHKTVVVEQQDPNKVRSQPIEHGSVEHQRRATTAQTDIELEAKGQARRRNEVTPPKSIDYVAIKLEGKTSKGLSPVQIKRLIEQLSQVDVDTAKAEPKNYLIDLDAP